MEIINAINTRLKDTTRFRMVLVLCGILAIIFREFEMFLYPRIWAEEATVFYAFARHHSVWDIFTTVHVGYITLFNSIVSTMQAKLFSVENAATVSTYMGFLIQLIPLYIIAFTTHYFWNSPLKKIVYVLIVVTVMDPELHINTTNSHFILGLITFLIMMISPNTLSRFQKHFFRMLLLLGGLTGPASILFTPTFLLKAYREKNKEKYIQAGIISICAIIQAGVILYSIFYNNTYNRLSIHNYHRTVYHYFLDNFSMVPHAFISTLHPNAFYFNLVFGVAMAILFLSLFIKTRSNIDYFIALLSLFIVGTFSTLGSLNMAGAPRYAYIPTCISLIILLSYFFEMKRNYFILSVFVTCLSINVFYYTTNINDWAYKPKYPKWKAEVAKWRLDSTYNPKIHPAFLRDDEWRVKL
jgi:hypothetical protein